MKNIGVKIAILIIAAALSGCAPQRAMYDLSGRDASKLAVIYGKKRNSSWIHTREAGANICSIDGKNVDPLPVFGSCEDGPLYLEPGSHEFMVMTYVGMIDGYMKVTLDLQAGHEYFFDATGSQTGFHSSSVSMSMSATVAFWIEDRTTGTVVYGRRPNTREW